MTRDAPSRNDGVEDDIRAAKAVYHPLRFRIFMQLMKRPGTVRDVADALGDTPNRLYYHFRILEEHGLIRVASTRLVSGIVEKAYESVPGRYKLARPVDVEGAPELRGVYSAVLQDAFRELAIALDADESSEAPRDDRPLFHWWTGGLTAKSVTKLRRKIVALVEDLRDEERRAGSQGRTYGIVLALYPGPSEPG